MKILLCKIFSYQSSVISNQFIRKFPNLLNSELWLLITYSNEQQD